MLKKREGSPIHRGSFLFVSSSEASLISLMRFLRSLCLLVSQMVTIAVVNRCHALTTIATFLVLDDIRWTPRHDLWRQCTSCQQLCRAPSVLKTPGLGFTLNYQNLRVFFGSLLVRIGVYTEKLPFKMHVCHIQSPTSKPESLDYSSPAAGRVRQPTP